jgi:outer membrane protein assembly factor BamB
MMLSRTLLLFSISLMIAAAPVWTRFRGPNGTGVAETGPLPVEMNREKNLQWRVEYQPGFSSPVLGEKCVFLTSYEAMKGFTACLDPKTGSELWRRQGFELSKKFGPVNTPVSATPVTDGKNVWVFFESIGLVSYDGDGNERWRKPLGTFNNPYGMANSPMLADGVLVLQADQDTGSYLLAVDAASGKDLWRTERPQALHGYSTPVLYRPRSGPSQLIVSESYQLTGYSLKTGEKLWWVDGMAWQAKSVPVLDGDMLYLHSWTFGLSEIAKLPARPWAEFLAEADKDKDGRIGKDEAPEKEMVKLWFLYDLDRTGFLEEKDYASIQKRSEERSGLFAIQLGGKGDLTGSAIRWKAEKQLPNIPSPVLYQGILYVLKEGGILTAYDAKAGAVVKQGRVEGALDGYFASLVASDGKIFAASHKGKFGVLKAGREWEVLKVNDLEEEIWATPAIEGGRIYLRTQKALYCFGLKN